MSHTRALELIQHAHECQAKRLNLSNLDLTELPPEIGQLTELQVLWLKDNRLKRLPSELGQLRNLRCLRLENNTLEALPPEIGQLTELRELSFHKNQVTEFPLEFWRLRKLQRLITAGNQLTQLPDEIGKLTELKELKLGGFLRVGRQRRYRLFGNKLTELPPAVAQLTNLQSLDLSANQLTELPPAVAQLTNLQSLEFEENPLQSPPPEVLAQGWEAIRAHLLEDKKRLWVSKMLVVGQGGVGKTSLLRRLRGEGFDPDSPTTHGMVRDKLQLTHPTEPGVEMTLNTWDFGGQEIYHATHQFFLTQRSLYLVVWNAREGHDQGKLDYWLDKLKALAGDSPVILVATHTEKYTPNLRLAELQDKHSNLITDGDHVFQISNETGDGIEQLREAIINAAAALPLMGELWPIKWRNAADAVREIAAGTRHVTPYKWRRMLSDHNVTGIAEQTLSVWLHELGEILYFRDDGEVDDTVILDPQWVTEIISRVLTCKQTEKNNAILTRHRMRELWDDVELSHDLLLRLMEKFDLSYRTLEDRDKSLIVELLPEDEDKRYEELWQAAGQSAGLNEVSMKYELDLTMPAGIPTWFIARQHRFTTNIHWRHGVLFQDESKKHLVLIRSLPSDRQVWLTVRGPAPHYFFDVLRAGLELTLNRFKRMQCKRLIPCKGHHGKPCSEEFELDDLYSFIEDGETHIQCRKIRPPKMVSVSDLLVGIRPETTLAKLEELLSEVRGSREEVAQLTAVVQQDFTRLFNSEQSKIDTECPNVFAIRGWSGESNFIGLLEPIHSPGMFDKVRDALGKRHIELQLYCQAPGNWHPLGCERGRTDSETGLYQLEISSEFLRVVGPHLLKLAKVMKYTLPVVGFPMPWIVDDEKYKKQFKEDIEGMKKLAESATAFEENQQSKFGRGLEDSRGARVFTGSEMRALRILLKGKDTSDRWGQLKKWLTKEGNWLWLCPYHYEIESRKP